MSTQPSERSGDHSSSPHGRQLSNAPIPAEKTNGVDRQKRPIDALDVLGQRYDSLIIRHDEGLNDPKLQIIITVENTQFNVNVKELCQNSCFFRTKIHNYWRQDEMPVISLDKQEPGAVHLFIKWLRGESTFNDGSSCNLQHFSYESLFHAFILGDNIQALPFQNDVMDVIRAKLSSGHPLDPVLPSLCYSNTPKGSPLRRLLLDAYVLDADPSAILSPAAADHLHIEFLRDLSAALLTLRDEVHRLRPRPYADGPAACPRYHNHELEGQRICTERKFTIRVPTPPSENTAQTPSSSTDATDVQPLTPGLGAASTPLVAIGTPGAEAGRDAAMTPKNKVIKREEPITPCPTSSAKRRRLNKRGSDKKNAITID